MAEGSFRSSPFTSVVNFPRMAFFGDILAAPVALSPSDEIGDADATTDAALVVRARVGDRDADEILYRRHVRYIHALLLRLLSNPAEAEDALQETFVIALDRLHALREPAAFRAWLAQVAISQARRRFRKQKLLRLLGLDGADHQQALAEVAASDTSADVRAEIATVQQILARLSIDERLAWSLRRLAGHSLTEIAVHCRCSLATVKRRVAAADALIHAELDVREETL